MNEGVDDIFEAATRQAMVVRAGASAYSGGLTGTIGTNVRSILGGDEMKSERRKWGTMRSRNGIYSGSVDKHGLGNINGNSSKGCCIVI